MPEGPRVCNTCVAAINQGDAYSRTGRRWGSMRRKAPPASRLGRHGGTHGSGSQHIASGAVVADVQVEHRRLNERAEHLLQRQQHHVLLVHAEGDEALSIQLRATGRCTNQASWRIASNVQDIGHPMTATEPDRRCCIMQQSERSSTAVMMFFIRASRYEQADSKTVCSMG